MILEITTDNDLVKSIMTDSDIWDKIEVDNIKSDDLIVNLPKNMMALTAKVKDVIGIHLFKEDSDRVVYHPMLLKPFRKEFGREFFDKGIKWLFDNTSFNFIDVEIPATHKSTINLARHLNFKDSGIKKDGVFHKGQFLDLQLLRLER